jgi:hypothetical protein
LVLGTSVEVYKLESLKDFFLLPTKSTDYLIWGYELVSTFRKLLLLLMNAPYDSVSLFYYIEFLDLFEKKSLF